MLTDLEKKIIALLQTDIPVVKRPFLEMAERIGITEDEFLSVLKDLDDSITTERSAPQRDVGDFYDDAESEKGRQLNHLLSERDRTKLAKIDDALEKIADQTYGICEEC